MRHEASISRSATYISLKIGSWTVTAGSSSNVFSIFGSRFA
jgi:hypothetical protein